MNIEQGDYFVVTRGFQLRDVGDTSIFALAFCGGESWKEPPKPKEPSYSRDHEGIIYRAEAVCGPMIAAVAVVADESYKQDLVGRRVSLNTNEVEVWPVTEAYVNVIRGAAAKGATT